MKVAKRDLLLALLYLVAAIAIFPIVYHLIDFFIGFDAPDRFVTARVALSGPMLVLVGIALTSISFTSLFKNRVHRILGIMFFCVGAAWLVMVVYALLTME